MCRSTCAARLESCEDVAGTDLIYRRSHDNGQTWSDAHILHSNSSSTESNVIGNAAPVVNSKGRVIVPFNRNNRETWMMYSDDDGYTWSQAEEMEHLQVAADPRSGCVA
jgi:Neuraminidase (sialidase)